MPLHLEELKGFMICDYVDFMAQKLVLPFEEGFENGYCLHLKNSVVHLCQGELLRHKASGVVTAVTHHDHNVSPFPHSLLPHSI